MESTTLLLEQSAIFSAGGANLLVVTMDQKPLLELARYVWNIKSLSTTTQKSNRFYEILTDYRQKSVK